MLALRTLGRRPVAKQGLARLLGSTAGPTSPWGVARGAGARPQALSRSLHVTPVSNAKVHNKHIDEEYNQDDTPFEWSKESLVAIEDVLSKYPSNYPMSAAIPVLWIAQKQHGGWLPLAAMNATAEVCKMAPILVYEVATFYTMFNRKKIGKYNIQMCTTTPCMVLGAYEVLDQIKSHLSMEVGADSPDGMFHLMEVDCLGACANAPMMQISHGGGDEYFVRVLRSGPYSRSVPHPAPQLADITRAHAGQ
jgi:NADH-quinone oxidoreductase E subunit